MEDKFAKHFLGMVSPTIILHQGCEDSCPGWLLDEIRMERMVESMKTNKDGKATDLEALAYVMTASLAAPLPESLYRIYMHLFRAKFPEQAKNLNLDGEGELRDLDRAELDKLKAWIFKQREKREKKRIKGAK